MIVKVKAINAMGKTKGCEKAPEKIIQALEEIGSNEKGKIIDKKLLNISEIKLNNNNLSENCKNIYDSSKKLFEKNQKTIFIGGDHSITYSIVRALKEQQNCFLIIFDAHADCMKPGKEPTHEEWLRKLVEEGFPARNILLIGTRNLWQEEITFLNQEKINFIKMNLLSQEKEEICDMIMEKARNSEGFYISIDIDAIDPAFAPGTGYPEPGGMSSRDLIYFLQRLLLLKNFKGGDIVEINPEIEKEKTIQLGAKILSEML